MKTRKLENWRIEVEPDFSDIDSDDSKREWCKAIARSIKRHVDGIETAILRVDGVDICSYCGERWTEDSDTYNGGCCDDDETLS